MKLYGYESRMYGTFRRIHGSTDIERNSLRANSTAETSPMLNDIGTVLALVSNEYVFWFEQLRASNNNPTRSPTAITNFIFKPLMA
jgi:hypothetical protein